MVASMMLLLMGIAALVADWGMGTSVRRAAQNASDASSLGSAIEFTINAGANPMQAAVDEVYDLVNRNMADAPTAADWTACVDPTPLARRTLSDGALLGVVGGSDCISWSANFDEVRVRIPTRGVDTFFGSVFGINQIDVAAEAHAAVVGNSGGGGFAFPTGVFSDAGGTEFCMKTGTGAQSHNSCGDPTTGDFGNFRPYWYAEIAPGGPNSECTSGEQPTPMSRVMAVGMDHELGHWIAGSDRRNGAGCPAAAGPPKPNMLDSAAGYTKTDISNGLVKGGVYDGAFAGRLDGGYDTGWGTTTVFGFTIDNRPLWTMIDPSVGTPECIAARAHPAAPADAAAYDAAWADMLACLSNHTGLLFTSAIESSARLSAVPKFIETTPLPNNSCCYHVDYIVPMWIQDLYVVLSPQLTCNGTLDNDPVEGTCVSRPGLNGTISIVAPGQRVLDSASGVVLECDHLPDDLCNSLSGGPGGGTNSFTGVELTR